MLDRFREKIMSGSGDVKDLVEAYVACGKDCTTTAEMIKRQLEDESGTMTLSHAVKKMLKVGYPREDIADTFRGSKYEKDVDRYLKIFVDTKPE